MPTKALPPRPNLTHLKHQAADLLKAHAAKDVAAFQRLREFHPRFRRASDQDIAAASLKTSDAQFALAREYGFRSWPRLKAHIEHAGANLRAPHHERIADPVFRRGVDLIDAGDEAGLRAHLAMHPDVVKRRVLFEGGNYFSNPALLEFVAENPIRHGKLPPNIAAITRLILEAGGDDVASMNETLGLVGSGQVPRECGVQAALIDVLCDAGADPNEGIMAALLHGEFAAADAMLRRGAKLDLPVAAALGRANDVGALLPKANAEERHLAVALAAQHRRAEIMQALLVAGEDPNRYNPVGGHAHCTPLHQAALNGDLATIQVLLDHDARLDMRDILFNAPPVGWAEHAGNTDVADVLRKAAAKREGD
jgi:hypothetical protein